MRFVSALSPSDLRRTWRMEELGKLLFLAITLPAGLWAKSVNSVGFSGEIRALTAFGFPVENMGINLPITFLQKVLATTTYGVYLRHAPY